MEAEKPIPIFFSSDLSIDLKDCKFECGKARKADWTMFILGPKRSPISKRLNTNFLSTIKGNSKYAMVLVKVSESKTV